jgi:hypothetical protein
VDGHFIGSSQTGTAYTLGDLANNLSASLVNLGPKSFTFLVDRNVEGDLPYAAPADVPVLGQLAPGNENGKFRVFCSATTDGSKGHQQVCPLTIKKPEQWEWERGVQVEL